MNKIRRQLGLKNSIDKIQIVPLWNMFTAAKNRLASGMGTKPAILRRLGRTVNASVQQRIAENRTTESATLELLSHHESADVRAAVAQNDNTSRATVDSLSGDASSDVRYAMAANARTSTALLETLSTDENPYVQDRAQRTQARLKLEPKLGEAKQADITLAYLEAMPKQTELLVAYCLEQNNPVLTLLDSDTDVCSLLSAGWLKSIPSSPIGTICFKFTPTSWRHLKSLQSKFLTAGLVSELTVYRQRKTVVYPWVW